MADPAPFRPKLPSPGAGAGPQRVAEILRVDLAGEVGAVAIYRGQNAVFGKLPSKAKISAELTQMGLDEAVHRDALAARITARQTRPSLLAPFWRAGGFALGAATALLGEKAAHACTEAVETVIGEHYAGQIAELEASEPELAAELSRFREEELAHRDHAISAGAQDAPGYAALNLMIQTGCKIAIKIAERI